MNKRILITASLAGFLALGGCKKDYLETVPQNAVSEAQIFTDISAVNATVEISVKI